VSRRKGEITPAAIRRQWPHRVELPPEAMRGQENSAATWGLGKELGAAPYPLSDFNDDRHFSVFHFKTAERRASPSRSLWRRGAAGRRGSPTRPAPKAR
jgi:hypothetical protein